MNTPKALDNAREDFIGNLRVLEIEMAEKLGRNVSEVTRQLEANYNEIGAHTSDKVAEMRSFVNMTIKCVNELKQENDLLKKTCCLIPLFIFTPLSCLPTPFAPFAALAACICHFLLDRQFNSAPNVDEILRKEIEINNIEDEVMGLEGIFQRAFYFLDGMNLENGVTEHQVEKMIDRIGIEIGAKEMGKLRSIILRNIERETQEDTLQVIHALVLYVRIHLLYTRLYQHMALIAKIASGENQTENNSFGQYRHMYMKEKEGVESFLQNIFKHSRRKARFFALFEASAYSELNCLLSRIGINLDLPHDKVNIKIALAVQLEPRKHEWMNMANNPWGTIWKTRTSPEGNKIHFKLLPVPNEKNWFFLLSARWTTWYVYVKNDLNLSGTKTMPGDEGKFKFVEIEDAKYMITVKSLPGKFIYMDDSILGRIKILKSSEQYNARVSWSIQDGH